MPVNLAKCATLSYHSFMHEKTAKSILSSTNGMNLYRGCTHGCIYCDSRSTCYGMDHPFEDVEVKVNAPALLEAALRRKRTRCMIGTGSMCDPYLPIEKSRELTRRCLELIDRYGFGVSLLTKSDLVLRDMDLLKSIHAKTKAVVCMTLTTYDESLCRLIEPNVCTTRRRFEVLQAFRDEGIPTVVWLTPLLPFINDTQENLQGVLDYCFRAGVTGILSAGMGVTLRDGDRAYFYQKLDEHFPGIKAKYIAAFGAAYQCPSPNAPALERLYQAQCRAHGVLYGWEKPFSYLTQFEDKQADDQMRLF